jgi:arylsulfatase A-like enzyme
MPDQTQLTTWYTERAVKFIAAHREQPFFLYVPHSMPHVPLHVSDKFKGKTENGLLGDVIAEIDWSVGQIVAALAQHGLANDTLVLFAADNGPWLSYGNHAGSAGPLREGRGTTWEGGHRVPCVVRWPGEIPAGSTCDQLCSTIDVLPTFARLAGAQPRDWNPSGRKIDGLDIWPLLASEPGAKTPRKTFYYYWNNGLDAVRAGRYKLHFPHAYRTLSGPVGKDGLPGGYAQAKTDLALYDLTADPGEKTNIADQHPDVVAELQKLAAAAREDLGDAHQNRSGKNRRPAGKVTP